VLLGRQGAGKGTQSTRLADHYGVIHVSTGDMFRTQATQGTAFGLEAKRYMDAGDLVPDEIVVGVIEECIVPGGPLGDGFVLDGFPRTLAQAEALDDMLREIGKPVSVILELRVPREVAVERMLARAGAEGRTDDTPDAIERRLALYDELTLPVVDHYAPTGNLVAIHGEQPVDSVWAEIQDALELARDHS
jgi:adenylate kinase